MNIAAIDTGAKGGITIFNSDKRILNIYEMPTNNFEHTTKSGLNIVSVPALIDIFSNNEVDTCIIEQVWAQKQDTSTTAFSQGAAYCAVLDACIALELEMHLIKPREWQKLMGCTSDKKMTAKKVVSVYGKLDGFYGVRGGLKDGITDSVMIGLAGFKKGLF